MISDWEDAYSKYQSATESEVGLTSRAVATAWHELAACTDLPWWLCAAVRSAAQAFEHQAEAWEARVVENDRVTLVPLEAEVGYPGLDSYAVAVIGPDDPEGPGTVHLPPPWSDHG